MKTTHAVILVVLAVIAGGLLFMHLHNPGAFGPGNPAPPPSPITPVAAKPAPTLPVKLAAPAVNAIQAANAKAEEASQETSAPAKPAPAIPKPTPAAVPAPAKPVAGQSPVTDPAPVAGTASVVPLPPAPSAAVVGSTTIMNSPSDVINAPADSSAPTPPPQPTQAGTPASTPIMSAAPPEAAAAAETTWTPPSPTPAQPNWTWTTTDGHVYHKVKVIKMDPQSITILHQDGGANVPMETLPPELQKLFNYNADAASQWGVGKLVAGNLVALRNNAIEPVNDAALRPARYVAIYYSAGWCPPCEAFTPKLVKFYNGFKPIHSNFEIIFVSEDRSPIDMASYMRVMNMPWLAVSYGALVHPPGSFKGSGIEAFAGDGIPDLVLLDATGKVLLDTYKNGKYMGPESVLDEIPSIVK